MLDDARRHDGRGEHIDSLIHRAGYAAKAVTGSARSAAAGSCVPRTSHPAAARELHVGHPAAASRSACAAAGSSAPGAPSQYVHVLRAPGIPVVTSCPRVRAARRQLLLVLLRTGRCTERRRHRPACKRAQRMTHWILWQHGPRSTAVHRDRSSKNQASNGPNVRRASVGMCQIEPGFGSRMVEDHAVQVVRKRQALTPHMQTPY